MAIREDLVQSAVTFLQDPSVANAPLDKRIAFLQSKNLTQEEIDASLAHASQGGPPPSTNYTYQQQAARPSPQQYGYSQPPGGYWQPPPPEVPGRDWRDFFILATVMSGLGYGAYFIAKRYIVPLIAPPTPPQLEQDKAAIDASFTRAFDLIEQLTTDTATIKASEAARSEKLDTALSEMDTVINDMKNSTRRRDDDSRRINEEIRSLQALIPKAMKAQEENTDSRLKELNTELKSLKTLISNRMSGQGVPQAGVQRGLNVASNVNGANVYNPQGTASTNTVLETSSAPVASVPAATETASAAPFNNRFGSRGGIPAWQMAAAKKNEESKSATEGVDGESEAAAASIVS